MAEQQGDIRMMGTLRKLKTMKKKFFVLRGESVMGPARLEYYDSEKKFRNSTPAKRTIELEHCFNINKKSDTKHKHAIALYTKDDCFAFVCDNEEDQEEWLKTALELQNCRADDGEPPKPLFEHIWQVTVKPKGLGNTKLIPHGTYRLCLTDKTLSLIRLNSDTADTQFQLPCIRRCGHTDCFFFMEVGRSSVTGPGELWMQVEDTLIAQNMHEAILSAMKSMKADAEQQQFMRPRSRSSCGSKPISVPRSRGSSPNRSSSDLHPPKRSKTISEGQCGSPRRPRITPGKMSTMRPSSMHPAVSTRGHSPALSSSPHSLSLSDTHAYRLRSDSLESRGSRGTSSSISIDEDMSPMEVLHSSVVSEEGSHYLSPTNKDSLSRSPEITKKPMQGYMEMSPSAAVVSPSGGKNSSYMSMSPAAHTDVTDLYADMGRCSYSTSPAVSTSSSMDTDDRGYLDMTPLGQSLPTVEEKSSAEGYMDMSASIHSSSPSTSSVHLRPEKVYSYLSDDSGAATPDDFPKRAYSVGSKPVNNRNKPRNHSLCEAEGHSDYLDTTNVLKCNSAPHLPEEDLSSKLVPKTGGAPSVKLPRNSSHKSINEEDGGFLMEMSFSRLRSDSESRGSQSSLGSCRSRTSSIGNDMRPRTSSAGAEMRPRTSSINNNEMRPRSASHGHKTSRFFRRFSRDRDKSGSSDSLKKMAMGLSRKTVPEVDTSQMSVKKFQDTAYMEVDRVNSKQDAGYSYIDVTPDKSSHYMEVSAPTSHTLMPPFPTGQSMAIGDKHSSPANSDYMSMSPGSVKGHAPKSVQGHSPTPKVVVSASKISDAKDNEKSAARMKLSAKNKKSSRASNVQAADQLSDYIMCDASENKYYKPANVPESSDYIGLDFSSNKKAVNPSVESAKMTSVSSSSVSSSSSQSSDYMNTGSQSSSPSNFNAKLSDFSSDNDSLTRSSSSVSSRNTKKLKVKIDKKKDVVAGNSVNKTGTSVRDVASAKGSSAYINVSYGNDNNKTGDRVGFNSMKNSKRQESSKTPAATVTDSYMIVSDVPLPPAAHTQKIQLDKIVSPIQSTDELIPSNLSGGVKKASLTEPSSSTSKTVVVKCTSPVAGAKISTGFKVVKEDATRDCLNIPATEADDSVTGHETITSKSVLPISSNKLSTLEPHKLAPSSGIYLPKRRSSPSLTSYSDQADSQDSAQKSKVSAVASSASGLLIPGNRHSLQASSSGFEQDLSNPAFKRSLSQTSPTSAEKELDYASLDLSSSSEFMGSRSSLQQDKVPRSPQSIKSRNSSGESYEDGETLQYAEIDFHKSKALRRSSSGLREGRFDFINQN